MNAPTKSHRPWRIIAVVVVLLLVVLVGRFVIVPYHKRSVAFQEIGRVSGAIGYNHTGSKWVVKSVIDELLWRLGLEPVYAIYLDHNTEATDETLTYVADIKNLEQLYVGRTTISDTGLVHLRNLTNLKVLDLSNTAITDDGLVNLRGLTDLKALWLDSTAITDEGLVNLRGLISLAELRLADCEGVSENGIAMLQQSLPGCRIDWP